MSGKVMRHIALLSAADQCTNGNSFLCADTYCISKELVCDGMKGCISGADELGCYYPDSCQALWDSGYQNNGIYAIG